MSHVYTSLRSPCLIQGSTGTSALPISRRNFSAAFMPFRDSKWQGRIGTILNRYYICFIFIYIQWHHRDIFMDMCMYICDEMYTYIHTSVQYSTVQSSAVHYITLHYITLHYITLHTYVYIYIHIHILSISTVSICINTTGLYECIYIQQYLMNVYIVMLTVYTL